MKHHPSAAQTFLLLQGPPGPFFALLGDALVRRGHAVRRINFNGGDRASWPGPSTDYRGSLEDWPVYFDMFVQREGVTDLILFGDCRPMHSAAHGMAKLLGVRTHVFEEGYIRPDWVTLERDGVNGHSLLPRDPFWYVKAAEGLPLLPNHPPIAASFSRRAWEALSYYTQATVQSWRFTRYRSHRPTFAVFEGAGWLTRFASRPGARERARKVLADLGSTPYFVFPLQLNSDHQVRTHSPFANVKVAIRYVIESFIRSAPAGDRLVIKEHPLDNGLINWRKLVRVEAARHHAADRILFLEDGDIAKIVEDARGVVTINSTTGTLALGKGVPVTVLGQAVYDIAGITHQGALDGFWQVPQPPRAEIYDAFCRVLLDRCLIRGGFLSDEGLALLVEGAVSRLVMSPVVVRPPGELMRV